MSRDGLPPPRLAAASWSARSASAATPSAAASTRTALDAILPRRPRDRASRCSTPPTSTAASPGRARRCSARRCSGQRDEFVLATKFGMDMQGANGEDFGARGSRRYVRRAVEASLRRLQTDHIDLYQLHRPDPLTPIERDARGAHRPRPRGQGALHRLLQLRRLAGRRRRRGRPRPRGWRRSCRCRTSTPCSTGPSSDEVAPACERFGLGHPPVLPPRPRPAHRQVPARGRAPAGSRAALEADRAGWLDEADWDRVEALQAFADRARRRAAGRRHRRPRRPAAGRLGHRRARPLPRRWSATPAPSAWQPDRRRPRRAGRDLTDGQWSPRGRRSRTPAYRSEHHCPSLPRVTTGRPGPAPAEADGSAAVGRRRSISAYAACSSAGSGPSSRTGRASPESTTNRSNDPRDFLSRFIASSSCGHRSPR